MPTTTASAPQRPADFLVVLGLTGDRAKVQGAGEHVRQDGVEEMWRVMQRLLDAPPPVQACAPGSWGPSAADALVADYGGWYGPWVAS